MSKLVSNDLGPHPDFPSCRVAHDPAVGYFRTHPYPTEQDLAAFYTREYREIRQENPTEHYIAVMRHRAAAQAEFILRNRPPKNLETVVDIGCGCGELLNALHPHASRCVGFETDRVMAAHAKANRLSDAIEIRNEHFTVRDASLTCDLLTMSHVLEHIPDPDTFLSKLRETVLRPGGLLFLEVPNDPPGWVKKQIDWNLRGLGHLNYFTPDSLKTLLDQAGYDCLKIRVCGKLLDQHIRDIQPHGYLRQMLGRILRRLRLERRPLPDYKTEMTSSPRIYLQVLAETR